MLDVSVFFNRRFSGGSLAVTAGFLTLFGFIFVITQYFQFIKGYSAFETGVRLLPVADLDRASPASSGPASSNGSAPPPSSSPGWPCSRPGLAWASTADAATPYIRDRHADGACSAAASGLTTAPATEAIMGSLSADKAGVGSAVNDTTRELGGTLGVAIVGSVFASVYSGRLGSAAVATLPAEVRATMERSMAAAQRSSASCRRRRVPDVREAVNTAFLDGLQIGSLVMRRHRARRPRSSSPWLLPARASKPPPSSADPRRCAA